MLRRTYYYITHSIMDDLNYDLNLLKIKFM